MLKLVADAKSGRVIPATKSQIQPARSNNLSTRKKIAIGVEHLDRYLDEFEFRFNNRDNPYLFRDILMRLLQTSNLQYKG